jgi:putative ATPase
MATHQACQVIGMPECRLNLAVSSIPVECRETADENSSPQHCVAYLSEAEKSTRAYQAYGKVSY